jgi:lactoylglutathione lyase
MLELTYNWDAEDYGAARNFGHLAFLVDDIYATCAKLQTLGVTINRPPRDGHMAFVRSPDLVSVELLQKGDAMAPKEPWASRTREHGEPTWGMRLSVPNAANILGLGNLVQ